MSLGQKINYAMKRKAEGQQESCPKRARICGVTFARPQMGGSAVSVDAALADVAYVCVDCGHPLHIRLSARRRKHFVHNPTRASAPRTRNRTLRGWLKGRPAARQQRVSEEQHRQAVLDWSQLPIMRNRI